MIVCILVSTLSTTPINYISTIEMKNRKRKKLNEIFIFQIPMADQEVEVLPVCEAFLLRCVDPASLPLVRGYTVASREG